MVNRESEKGRIRTCLKLDLELCRVVGTVYLLTEITGLSHQINTFFIEFNTVLCSYLPIQGIPSNFQDDQQVFPTIQHSFISMIVFIIP